MTSLADFLLARIAEDEEWARWAGAAQDAERSRGVAFVSSLGSSSVTSAGRVLARCEADRRIVELRERLREPRGMMDRLTFPTAGASLDAALRLLALSYAEHPDYDEAWRP